MSKPHILICADWFWPGYKAGGPVRSLDALTRALGAHCTFSVLTTDRDFGDSSPYPGITPDVWTELRPGLRVMYLSPAKCTRGHIGAVVRGESWDCLYLNSMFSVPFTLAPLLAARKMGRRILLAPRGMLHAGALSLKPFKKRLFLSFFRLLGLSRKLSFQATDAQEEQDIRRVFGPAAQIQFAPNLPAPLPPDTATLPKVPGTLRLVFISRIARKKNIHYLLERLAGIPGTAEIECCGPVEDAAYWAECEAAAARLSGTVRLRATGPLPPEQVTAKLQSAHAFFLPTLGENFGHAIWEALAAGRPVLLSDRTPWRNLEAAHAGWDLSLEQPEAWKTALTHLMEMDQVEWESWATGARAYADAFLRSSEAVQQNIRLFCPGSPLP